MKRIWGEIGFNPTSFELPASDENDEENDKPIAETDRFKKVEPTAPVTAADRERYIGLTIANINLDIGDDDLKKFVADYVSKEIEGDAITIVREKKKAILTINHSLTSEIVKEAMEKINFANCKEKFFGKPLYCRPLREMTPEKPAEKTPLATTPNQSLVQTGTKSKEPCKKIPGLPPSAQSKAIERQRGRDKKEKKEKEKKLKLREEAERQELEFESKIKQAKIGKNLTAFDVLMNAQQFQADITDPRDDLIPAYCSPSPWVSKFGQQVSYERRLSFGSSPSLNDRVNKRGPEQLSSPSSPSQVNELKKNKSEFNPVSLTSPEA